MKSWMNQDLMKDSFKEKSCHSFYFFISFLPEKYNFTTRHASEVFIVFSLGHVTHRMVQQSYLLQLSQLQQLTFRPSVNPRFRHSSILKQDLWKVFSVETSESSSVRLLKAQLFLRYVHRTHHMEQGR